MQRTISNIYSVVSALFRDAKHADLIDQSAAAGDELGAADSLARSACSWVASRDNRTSLICVAPALYVPRLWYTSLHAQGGVGREARGGRLGVPARDKKGFRANVVDLKGSRGEREVLIDSTEPAMLCAAVLRHQRSRNKLSLADVAERLGKSRNVYSTYERGEREPSVRQFRELLAAVAPDMALIVGPRNGRAA